MYQHQHVRRRDCLHKRERTQNRFCLHDGEESFNFNTDNVLIIFFSVSYSRKNLIEKLGREAWPLLSWLGRRKRVDNNYQNPPRDRLLIFDIDRDMTHLRVSTSFNNICEISQ